MHPTQTCKKTQAYNKTQIRINMATLTSHGQTPSAAPAAKAGVTKRLRAELMKLMMAGDKNATAFPCGDNLL